MKSKFNILYEEIMNDLNEKQFVGQTLQEVKDELSYCDDGAVLQIDVDFSDDNVITGIFVDDCPWPEEFEGKVLVIRTENYDEQDDEQKQIKKYTKRDILDLVKDLPDNTPVLIYIGEEDTGVITNITSDGLIETRLLSREPAWQ